MIKLYYEPKLDMICEEGGGHVADVSYIDENYAQQIVSSFNAREKIIEACQKFVNKVESGRAISNETYADLKEILEMLNG